MSKKLSVKQKRFADEYIISGNATEAAIKAGYSKKTASVIGCENLIKPNIKKYIDERLKEIESTKIADQKEVLEYLTQVLRGEIKEEILQDNGAGKQIIAEINIPIRERTKAAELLGKRYSLWTDKIDMTGNIELIFEDDYGDEDE